MSDSESVDDTWTLFFGDEAAQARALRAQIDDVRRNARVNVVSLVRGIDVDEPYDAAVILDASDLVVAQRRWWEGVGQGQNVRHLLLARVTQAWPTGQRERVETGLLRLEELLDCLDSLVIQRLNADSLELSLTHLEEAADELVWHLDNAIKRAPVAARSQTLD